MTTRRFALASLAACFALTLSPAANAGSYPDKPIRLIVPFPPGGGTDAFARMLSPKISEYLGQQVVVDNRAGAQGSLGTAIAAKSPPDGYTILVAHQGALTVNPHLYSNTGYDTLRDFAAVARGTATAMVVVAHPSMPATTLKEVAALAKQKPGALNFGSSGIGSGTHYAGEFFNLSAGIKAVHVPYKGTPEVITDVVSGRMNYAMSPLLAAMTQVRAGRLIAVGVTSPQRLPIAPDIPALGEAVPGFEYQGWFGVLAPARVPRPLVNRLSQEIGRILELPDVRERIARDGSIAKRSTPEELDKLVRDEIVTRRKVFRAAGVKPE